MDKRFTDIIQLIKQSRTNAIKAVNAELINLYWKIGKYINMKIEQSEWGDSVVTELAKYIQTNEPEIKGFSDKNIWRMKQFFETYKDSYVFEFLNNSLTMRRKTNRTTPANINSLIGLSKVKT